MKVMIICDYPISASDINGGVAAAAFNLVNSLLEYTSVTVTVIGHWPDFNEPSPKTIQKDRLKIIRLPATRSRAHLRGFRSERKLFSKFLRTENPDIIHAQGEGLYARVAVDSGRPNVYTIHGVGLKELEVRRHKIGALSYILRRRFIRNHYRKATNIIAINEYTKNAVSDLHNAKVTTIHNAVDRHFFDLWSDNEIAPGKLLMVGGVRSRKDVLTGLKAIKILRDKNLNVSLDIVGPSNEDLLAAAKKYISAHSLGDNVHIHGLVSQESVEKFYRDADIFLLSSIEESSPIAIVQAMAAGKPIVSTNVGGIAEMINDDVNGYLVDAGDFTAIAENIERLLSDRKLRSDFSLASRQLAINEWSNESVALKTYELYEEILSEW